MATDIDTHQPDPLLRTLCLVAVYGLYLLAFCLVAIGVSALSPHRRSAAIALFAFWFVFVVLVPRLAGDLALARTPQPDATEIANSLGEIGMAFWDSEELRESARQRAMDEYGVATEEDLPIDYAAYELQFSEEYADPLYAKVYRELNGVHAAQERTLSTLSIISPTLAVARLSAGLAGTDRAHHLAFTEEAELHRQEIIKQMNDDMMLNAGDAGYSYQSDPAFWEEIADFHGSLPPLSRFASRYLWDVIALLAWLGAAFLFARTAVARAGDMERVR